jgi:CRISPR-associated protein Csh2
MSESTVQAGEVLFVKCVKDGIPNRDPLRDSDARRLFGPDDGRISLSDVSIKRDVRDYVLARCPGGRLTKDEALPPRYGVWVRKEFAEGGETLLGREGLARVLLDRYRSARPAERPSPEAAAAPPEDAPPAPSPGRGGGRRRPAGGAAPGQQADPRADERDLLAASFDMRVFGAVFSVGGRSFSRVGPVQFGWAHSLHPVETKYTQGTVCMPSQDARPEAAEGEDTGGRTQGTIWTMYQLPFAVFAMPGVINAPLAAQAGMDAADVELLLEGLWKGTLLRQARGRGLQQPLLLVHVEYKDPFFRLGFLEEGLRLEPGRDGWLGGNPPTSLTEVTLNVQGLGDRLRAHADRVGRVRIWTDPLLRLDGDLPGKRQTWPVAAPPAAS